jgi:hypothetical protein
MGIKISELQSFVGNVQDTDLLEISVDNGLGGFNSRKITGAQLKTLIQGFTLYDADGTISSNRTVDVDGNSLTFNKIKEISFSVDGPTSGFNPYYKITTNKTVGKDFFQIYNNTDGQEQFRVMADGKVEINSAYTLTEVDGGAGQVLTTDGAGSVSFENTSTGLFSQTADGTAVTNTTTPTNILGSGVGSLTVPANGFSVGDSFHCNIKGEISSLNNETLVIELKSGAVTLATSGTLTLPTLTSQPFELETDFTIRAIGGTTTASIFTCAEFNYIQNSGTSFQGKMFQSLNNTTFDTTISNTLEIHVTWGTANASNSIQSRLTNLRRIY